MPYGIYTVHQVSGWEGSERMPDFDVFISQNGATYRYLLNNAPFNSFIKIVKQDAETGKAIPYAGAGFQIYDPNGNLVTMTFTYPTPTTIDVFYTDAEGSLVTPEKLPFGKGYSIVEVQAPYGYVLDDTPVYFDVTEDNSTEESGVTVVKVDKLNMAQKGTITVEKTGEVFFGVSVIGGVDESENELPTIYQPQYEKRGLPGAVYEIVAAEDIITPDGTVRNTKGEVVDTVTTDENGVATSRELYLGKYEVREITAPHGMVLNPEPHSVELVYAGQSVAVTETATSFENERQKVEIRLVKSIADRRQLLNGNEFILGVSGGGKSFTAKGEIINQVLAGNADIIIIDPEREYVPLVRAMGGEIINISATSPTHINAMDMTKEYGDGANPVILKSEFIMSLCEQLIGGNSLGAVQKSIIDRCTASVYRTYQQNDYTGEVPTLQDFRAELLKQPEPEAQEIALAIELFTNGSLNTFAKKTNVDTDNRLICYDILDLGKQLMPIGMLVVLDSILNRITANRAKGKNTFIFIDEIYLLFQHEYSANFLFTLWKRVRKYGAYATGITQNVDDLLQSHTARTMLANSEFIVMLNQASTDRLELAKLLNISDTQLSYITNVDAGHGLIKVGSSLVPFANEFPKHTKLYQLMTTKPGEGA